MGFVGSNEVGEVIVYRWTSQREPCLKQHHFLARVDECRATYV